MPKGNVLVFLQIVICPTCQMGYSFSPCVLVWFLPGMPGERGAGRSGLATPSYNLAFMSGAANLWMKGQHETSTLK